jgi:hypothetical protein
MPGLCIVAGVATLARLAGVTAFTLAWTHSVEKIAWEEEWRVEPAGLHLVMARVRGSGAGMEPPPESRRVGDAWEWQPHVPVLPKVVLRRSGATEDWRLCPDGAACRPLSDLVPAHADPVVMTPCDRIPAGP